MRAASVPYPSPGGQGWQYLALTAILAVAPVGIADGGAEAAISPVRAKSFAP
jgi:hypothetical protein